MRTSAQKNSSAKNERVRKLLSVSDVILAFHKYKVVDAGLYFTRADKARGSIKLYKMNKDHNLELIAIKGKTESVTGSFTMVVINPDFQDFDILKLVVNGCISRERIFLTKALKEIKRETFSELELSRLVNDN